jgi:DNA adenine methylase
MTLRAPFPYFGGKLAIARLVWARFGDVPNYVEPFAGSLAVLLARPDAHSWWERIETVNDLDGMIANYWRAVQHDAAAVARWADWPVNENDLHARHAWLLGQRERIVIRLEGDPDWHDAKVAGWWLWGICAWIGSGWCAGAGPW